MKHNAITVVFYCVVYDLDVVYRSYHQHANFGYTTRRLSSIIYIEFATPYGVGAYTL